MLNTSSIWHTSAAERISSTLLCRIAPLTPLVTMRSGGGRTRFASLLSDFGSSKYVGERISVFVASEALSNSCRILSKEVGLLKPQRVSAYSYTSR